LSSPILSVPAFIIHINPETANPAIRSAPSSGPEQELQTLYLKNTQSFGIIKII